MGILWRKSFFFLPFRVKIGWWFSKKFKEPRGVKCKLLNYGYTPSRGSPTITQRNLNAFGYWRLKYNDVCTSSQHEVLGISEPKFKIILTNNVIFISTAVREGDGNHENYCHFVIFFNWMLNNTNAFEYIS